MNMKTDPFDTLVQRVCASPETTATQAMDLLKLMLEREETKKRDAYFFAMAHCQSTLPEILATAKNADTNSTYADLAAIYAVAKPITTGHGFSLSTFPAASEKQGYLAVNWILRHADGYSESGQALVPMDGYQANGTHAFGSSNSYARRYIFCMAFDLAITREDDDGNRSGRKPVQTVSDEQLEAIRHRAETAMITEAAICRAEAVETLSELPATHFSKVMRNLQVNLDRRAALAEPETFTANLGE